MLLEFSWIENVWAGVASSAFRPGSTQIVLCGMGYLERHTSRQNPTSYAILYTLNIQQPTLSHPEYYVDMQVLDC